MGASNYPPGVSDSHPYFNPPGEAEVEVVCESEEAVVIPSFWIKSELIALRDQTKGLPAKVSERLSEILIRIYDLEADGDYECKFGGKVELPGETADAEWDCPVCGTAHTEDTMTEDEDPDRGWDERNEE
jgi:hypothetical protein